MKFQSNKSTINTQKSTIQNDGAETRRRQAVTDFLRHLRERNASPHTIKAYSGDLANFAAYAGTRGWKSIDHIAIRGFLSQLYEKGFGKNFGRAVAGGGPVLVSLAGAGGRGRTESGETSCDAKAAQKTSAGSNYRRNEFRTRRKNAGGRGISRARPSHARTAVWLRHPKFGTDRNQPRQYSPSAEAILIRGKGKKERYVPFGDSVEECAGSLPSGAPGDCSQSQEEPAFSAD